MAIFRIKHEDNYSCIDNNYARDKELSWKAKGLLTYMLTCKDDWDFNVQGITSMGEDGHQSVLSGLRELEKKGYLRRTYEPRKNTFGYNMVYDIFETKQYLNFYDERKHKSER